MIMFWFHSLFFVIPFLIVILRNALSRRPVAHNELLYTLLLAFLVVNVGVQGIVTGVIQLTGSEGVCLYANRPWSPFVWEVGMMHISYGVIGLLCYWLRGNFWAAVGFGYSLFLIMAFTGHMYEAYTWENYSLGNIGPQVWIDLATALVLVWLLTRRSGDE